MKAFLKILVVLISFLAVEYGFIQAIANGAEKELTAREKVLLEVPESYAVKYVLAFEGDIKPRFGSWQATHSFPEGPRDLFFIEVGESVTMTIVSLGEHLELIAFQVKDEKTTESLIVFDDKGIPHSNGTFTAEDREQYASLAYSVVTLVMQELDIATPEKLKNLLEKTIKKSYTEL